MDEYGCSETPYGGGYHAPYKFRPIQYGAGRGDLDQDRPQIGGFRIELAPRQRQNVKSKYFRLAAFGVVYCIYMYIVWKINTGQGDSDHNATYWRRWAYLQVRKGAHKVAYKADLVDMTYKDKYEKLTEHAWLV